MCVLIAILIFLAFTIGGAIHYMFMSENDLCAFKDFLAVLVVSAGVNALITCLIAFIFALFTIF